MRSWRVATLALVACATAWACDAFDASADATPGDAPTDAGSGEASVGDAGATSFCASQDASLCWSFDEVPYLVGPRFVLQAAAGTIRTTDDDPHSAPYALDVALTTGKSEPDFVGLLHQQAPTTAHVTCSFHVKVLAAGTTDVLITQLSGNASATTATRIAITPDLAFSLVLLQAGKLTTTPLGTHALGTWLEVELEVDAANLAATARVERSGGDLRLDADASASLNGVYVGLATAGPPSAWRVAFDDFVCRGF